MIETEEHKRLKLKAIIYLKKLGHKNIREEYSVPINIKGANGENRHIIIDIVALDGDKKAIECGILSHVYDYKKNKEIHRGKVIESLGFEFIHLPFSKDNKIQNQRKLIDNSLIKNKPKDSQLTKIQKSKLKKVTLHMEVAIHEIWKKKIIKYRNNCIISFPMKYAGKEVIIIIPE